MKRRTRWVLTAWLGLLAVPADVARSLSGESQNLAANPSFELGDRESGPRSWSADSKVYALDSQVRRSGGRSLKFVNRDPNQYLLCTQQVALRAGAKYEIGVWVRTQDIAGSDTGATIALECVDKNGKWLGGFYPSGVKGSRDWTHVRSVIRLSNDAAVGHLTCYARRGMTGTAWFDDVTMRQILDHPIRVELLSPAYRGWIGGATESIGIRVHLNREDCAYDPAGFHVEAALCDGSGKVLQRRSGLAFGKIAPGGGLPPLAPVVDIRFNACEAGSDALVVQTTLQDRSGTARFTDSRQLSRAPPGLQDAVHFDAHRRLIVDGKPFFPLGMYWAGINEPDLAVFAESKFNCLMPYFWPTREQMDWALRHRLRVIFSVKDFYLGTPACPAFIKSEADEEPSVRKYVRQFRDHPALLAWYLNDELGEEYMPRLKSHYRWVREEDPRHPAWAALFQYRDIAFYRETFDVVGTDPYPIGLYPTSMVSQWTRETYQQVLGARPVWQVVQVHNQGLYQVWDRSRVRTPTEEEIRNMAWQCLCEGATGLLFYSWDDMKQSPDAPFARQWEGLKRVVAEIDGLAPVLLSSEPVPAIRVEATANKGNSPGWIHWTARRHQGKLYVLAVNDGDGSGEVRFILPGKTTTVRPVGQAQLAQAVTITSDGWTVNLPPLAVMLVAAEDGK